MDSDSAGLVRDAGGPPPVADEHAAREDRQRGDEVAAGPDRAVTVDDALHSLAGGDTARDEVARAAEILADALRRRPTAASGPLTVFTGEVKVGRDFSIGSRGPRGRSAPKAPIRIDPTYLADYTESYVKPDGIDEADRILRNRHVLVLAGTDGTGREAAALVLLSRVLGAIGAPVFELAPACLSTDSGWSPDRSTGYLAMLDGQDDRSFHGGKLDDGWLTGTATRLREADSFLVVVTGRVRGALAEATRRGDFVFEQLEPPEPYEIVLARVRNADLPHRSTEAEQRMTAAGVQELLEVARQPRFAVRVAHAVIAALADDANLTTALAPLLDPREHVRDWFDHHREPEQVALAVTAAVLEGSSYLTVSDAAMDLHRALTSRSGPRSTRFLPRLDDDQRWLGIRGVEGRTGATVPEVHFRSRLLGPEVLRYAWVELDGWRTAFLGWLERLVAHSDVEVRARAAAAAGQVVEDDFQHALHRYLLPWARSSSALVRQSSALALGLIGTDARHSEQVWTLLRQWAKEVRTGVDARLPHTATMALAGPLGVADPRRALRILRSILADGDWALVLPAALSTLQLADEGCANEVLDALLDWTRPDRDNDLQVRALMVFSFAVRQRGAASDRPADGEDDEDETGWPALLTRAGRSPDGLPELMGRALNRPEVRDLALEALREWLHLVDEDWTAYGVILDILAGVADRSDRDADRLLHHLERCAQHDEPSKAAAEMHDALVAAGEDEGDVRW